MKTFAQKDYSENLGTGDVTIAEGGALLIAITNVLNRLGHEADPLEVNAELVDFQAFGGERGDQLSYTALSHILPDVGIADDRTVTDLTIYQLAYKGVDGSDKLTYAAVDPEDHESIIDSYDGLSKKAGVYGEIVDFTTYFRYPLLGSTAKPVPEAVQEPVESTPDTYDVIVQLKGYGSAQDAKDRVNPLGDMPLGGFYVFDQDGEAVNLTSDVSTPGWWINIIDNVKPEDGVIEDTIIAAPEKDEPELVVPLPEAPIESVTDDGPVNIPVRTLPPDPNKWQASYKKFLNVRTFKSTVDTIVSDLALEQPSKTIRIGTMVAVAGTFEKDGASYYRTAKSVQDGHWYGVPANAVKPLDEDDEDEDIDKIYNGNGRDKAIKTVATAEGKVKNIFSFGRKKQ